MCEDRQIAEEPGQTLHLPFIFYFILFWTVKTNDCTLSSWVRMIAKQKISNFRRITVTVKKIASFAFNPRFWTHFLVEMNRQGQFWKIQVLRNSKLSLDAKIDEFLAEIFELKVASSLLNLLQNYILKTIQDGKKYWVIQLFLLYLLNQYHVMSTWHLWEGSDSKNKFKFYWLSGVLKNFNGLQNIISAIILW